MSAILMSVCRPSAFILDAVLSIFSASDCSTAVLCKTLCCETGQFLLYSFVCTKFQHFRSRDSFKTLSDLLGHLENIRNTGFKLIVPRFCPVPALEYCNNLWSRSSFRDQAEESSAASARHTSSVIQLNNIQEGGGRRQATAWPRQDRAYP